MDSDDKQTQQALIPIEQAAVPFYGPQRLGGHGQPHRGGAARAGRARSREAIARHWEQGRSPKRPASRTHQACEGGIRYGRAVGKRGWGDCAR